MTTIGASLTPSVAQAAHAAGNFGKASTALVGEIEAAAAKLFSAAAVANLSSAKTSAPANAPQLRQPDMARASAGAGLSLSDSQRLTSEAWLLLLLGQLQELLQGTSTASMRSRLELLKQMSEAQKANYTQLAERLNQAAGQVDQATDVSQEAAEQAQRAMAAANEAAERVRQLRAQLAGLSWRDSNYAAVEAQLQQAEAELSVLTATAQNALQLSDVANGELMAAMNELASVEAEIARQVALGPPALNPPSGRMTNQAKLSELMATLSQIMSEAALLKLSSDSKLAIEVLNERAAENRRLAEEQAAKEAKAAHLQKVMGCIGKVLGWLISVVAVVVGAVGAIFTGGLTLGAAVSLSIAVIGLIMAVVEEATKFSVIGEAIKPFVEHVIQPLIKAIGDMITKILLGAGVDEATAKKVGSILGAVLAAVLIVVVAVVVFVVGRSAAANLLKHIGPMIQKLVQNLVPQLLKTAGNAVVNVGTKVGAKIGAAAAKTLGSTVDDLAINIGRVTVATQVAQVTNGVVQSTGSAVVADMRVEVARILAELDVGLALSNSISTMLEDSQEAYAKLNDLVMQQVEKITDVIAATTESGQAIIGNMRGSASAA